MRSFVALDIDDAVREHIRRFVDGVSGFAPDIRFVRPESLHVTLKFIGELAEESVDDVKKALNSIQSGTVDVTFRGYGFFPSATAARVFWVGIESGHGLRDLAKNVDDALLQLNIPKEEHVFSPHLTLARAGRGSGAPRRQKEDGPNRRFQRLQEKLAKLPTPEFGTITAREFFLYKSQTSPRGSIYTQIARFALT
jgi:2'-5' RNA ligase